MLEIRLISTSTEKSLIGTCILSIIRTFSNWNQTAFTKEN